MSPFKTILVAADFSARSREAFHVATSFAAGPNSRLIVLHVVDQTPAVVQPVAVGELGLPIAVPDDTGPHQQELFERLRDQYAPDRPIEAEYRVVHGAAVDEIPRVAREAGADLIALGTHGRTGLRRLVAGSVAEAVLRRAPCPVLAYHVPENRPPEAGPVRLILHPTDLSACSEAALRAARILAREHGAQLVVLYVDPIEALEGVALAPPVDPRYYLEPLAALAATLEGSDLKYPVKVRSERGDPATEIVRVAEETGCNLIVLGSHGRTALGRMLMGSVAEAVLRRAPCPTLIVKAARVEAVEPSREAEPGTVLML